MSASLFEAAVPKLRVPRLLRAGATVIAAAAAWTLAQPAAAQTGSITGRVTDAANQAPIGSVQVYIVGANLGALSSANGRYLVASVPPGTYQLRAERPGYAPMTQSVTVAAGPATIADFQLTEQAIGLDEIVVTGEAGAVRKREIGHTVAQLSIAEVAEPGRDVEALLSARVVGAVITESSGSAGSGQFIQLRGINSVGSSRVDLQACKLEYSIVSPK